MYERPFKLEIVSPRGAVFAGDVTSVSAPGDAGAFQILYNHAPLVSTIGVGRLKVKMPDGTDICYATSGGVVQVRDNHVTVLAEAVERADQIDVDRARAALERAEGRLKRPAEDVNAERARFALRRAQNRLRIAAAT
jgi:F-type H+-transporting ATPase subunit epsilon